jgi:predicted transposase YbfD/YdcC
MEDFRACFSDLPDPRAANARHDLLEVLFIALAALLCGAQGCSDMAEFGEAKESFLRGLLRLEHGIPSHDTFSRVFRLLDPQAFEAGFRHFAAAFAESLTGVVAIDGKAVRGAFERGRRSTPLHLVNVWAAEARLAIAQRLAPNRNEVAAALEVLQLLSLKHCIVTADALHCHAKMAQAANQRCSPMPGSCWNPPPHLNKLSWRLSKAMDAKSSARPSWYLPIPWGPSTAFQVSRHWRGSSFGDASTAGTKSPWCGISPCRRPLRLLVCSPSCGPIGASRTNSIGCSMWSSMKTGLETARAMDRRTLLSCANSPSTYCAPTRTKPRSDARSSTQAGTTSSSSACSPKCDSPAHRGGG